MAQHHGTILFLISMMIRIMNDVYPYSCQPGGSWFILIHTCVCVYIYIYNSQTYLNITRSLIDVIVSPQFDEVVEQKDMVGS